MKKKIKYVDDIAYRKAKNQAWESNRSIMAFNLPISLFSGFLLGVTIVSFCLKAIGHYSDFLFGTLAAGIVPLLAIIIYRKIEWHMVSKYIRPSKDEPS